MRRQLLQDPAVAVRVVEGDERAPRLHVDLAGLHAVLDQRWRAAAASGTTTCTPRWVPGGIWVMPVPNAIEHAEPGRGELDEAQLLVDLLVVVGVEADLIDVERLGAVDVGHRDEDQFDLPVHVHTANLGQGSDRTIRIARSAEPRHQPGSRALRASRAANRCQTPNIQMSGRGLEPRTVVEQLHPAPVEPAVRGGVPGAAQPLAALHAWRRRRRSRHGRSSRAATSRSWASRSARWPSGGSSRCCRCPALRSP